MRHTSGILMAAIALSCAEPSAPTQPNTDVGLRVWAELSPSRISLRDSNATVQVRVIAQNPGRDTIRLPGGPPYVFVSGDPAQSRGLEHSYRIARDTNQFNAGPGVDYWGQPEYAFAPGAIQRSDGAVSIRVWRDGGWPLTVGTYRVRSYFNGHEGASATLTVAP
jgi:hypothetical protein